MSLYRKEHTFLLCMICLLCISCQSSAQQISLINHTFTKIEIAYDSQDGCSFSYSPLNFCDEKYVTSINEALKEMEPNFNNNYIIITIEERPEHHQKSILTVDVNSGIAYPVPIDFYSGKLNSDGSISDDGDLLFNKYNNKLCINGSILVYRSIQEGEFCFFFEKDRFIGYETEYMH